MHLETHDGCIMEKPLQQLQLFACIKTLSKTLVLQSATVKDVVQKANVVTSVFPSFVPFLCIVIFQVHLGAFSLSY